MITREVRESKTDPIDLPAAPFSQGGEKSKILVGRGLGKLHPETARHDTGQGGWPTKGPHDDTPETEVFVLRTAQDHGDNGSRLGAADGANEDPGGRHVVCKPGVFDPCRFEFNEKSSLHPEPTLTFRHRVILALRKKGAINAIVKEPGVRRDSDETSGPSPIFPHFAGRSLDSERAGER